MKPLKLEFKGINSFSEHTIIDFEALTKNGIFGIFGDTGSGKSTILDCINFALYGNVNRSEVKTDIINYRCASAEVKFTFNIINDGKRKTYTVERVLKKDKSGTHKAVLYENDGTGELCIADKTSAVEKKIEEIVGVNDDDFRKCIALPQGEFAEFVKSTPSVRLALIERLFSLSKYGDRLKEKLSLRQRETEDIYQQLSGRLQGFEDVSEENIKKLKTELEGAEKRLKGLLKNKKTADERLEGLKVLNAKRAEFEKTIKRLEELTAVKGQMEELRKSLSSLPACREVLEASLAEKNKRAEASECSEKLKKLEKELSATAEKISAAEDALKKGDFDEKIARCAALAASFASCEGKPEKLAEILSALVGKRNAYKAKEKEREKLLSDKAALEEAVLSAEEALKNCDGADLEQLISVQFKGAVLRSEYAYNLEYFTKFKSRLEEFYENSPLYLFAEGEMDKKIAEYKQRLSDVRDVGRETAEEKIKRLQQAEEKKEALRKSLTEKREELQKIISLSELNQSELAVIKRDGEELRKRADELDAELKKVFGADCTDFKAKDKQNAEEAERLKVQKQKLTARLDNAKTTKSDLQVAFEKCKMSMENASAEADKLSEKIAKLLKSSKMESVEYCKSLVEKFSGFTDAESQLSEYDGSVISLQTRLKELEKTDGIRNVTDEVQTIVQSECERLDDDINSLTGQIAVLKADLVSNEKRLKEKTELLNDFKRVSAERDLIYQLKELTKANKFLEFIANEYLCDISSLASSTLLKLTDGRYFLTYNDNNFFVADNYDCGNLRGVNTLSGGETFLVSLSLALALSQTICAKSLKSIEFFFLDEGFGTLDSTLVDTVMTALEKLKSADFTIGVISHVEELKHRIDSKITVNKATESHGSTVSVSC